MDINPTPSPPISDTNHHHHHPPLPSAATHGDPSPKKALSSTVGDRLKRDEWSEGAVATLLEAYESKWVLRNRAKLKGHDWEDVARHVSSRANFTKSPKTQTQCKNKIESMKKRYRSESASAVDAAAASSSWPLYHRLDLLLRGNTQPPPLATSVILVDAPPPPPPPPPPFEATLNCLGSNGVDGIIPKEDRVDETRVSDKEEKNKNNNNNVVLETDSSTPAMPYSDNEKLRSKQQPKAKKTKMKKKKKKKTRMSDELDEIASSIRWLAEVVTRSEQTRMETMRDIERMRAEAEAKRGEMDLKRTEIIANTQLEIAKLFAAGSKAADSSSRIGRPTSFN
ncbi:trihelix transcription factor ASIL2-like [Cucurbita moschata]|uniref:Trihelix transcription factor ASIL2-like n=1 Tax=Cucurbita moschata TaxID=3662 RepID=A0A6J1G0N7_CUCMO|nr:trihelix transcription factor ASIL2-like [Cucurbita moschata]